MSSPFRCRSVLPIAGVMLLAACGLPPDIVGPTDTDGARTGADTCPTPAEDGGIVPPC